MASQPSNTGNDNGNGNGSGNGNGNGTANVIMNEEEYLLEDELESRSQKENKRPGLGVFLNQGDNTSHNSHSPFF